MMHKIISIEAITNVYNMLKIPMMKVVKDFKWCLKYATIKTFTVSSLCKL